MLYGSGLRLMECVRLRIKDVDFSYRQIVVRDGNGHKKQRCPKFEIKSCKIIGLRRTEPAI